MKHSGLSKSKFNTARQIMTSDRDIFAKQYEGVVLNTKKYVQAKLNLHEQCFSAKYNSHDNSKLVRSTVK